MTENTKLKLETDYKCIDSEICQDLMYAIPKDLSGIYIVSGDDILPVRSEYVVDFIKEWFEIWKMYGKDGSK